MSTFIPIQYHGKKYPNGITPKIKEAAGNFDVVKLDMSDPFSLHTEYSFASRKMSSAYLDNLVTIKSSCKNGIPQLWFSKKWASEFADFIFKLTEKNENLKIIEVHPPFSDYSKSIQQFIQRYKVFEDKILSEIPNVNILIENRFGSQYRGGKFIFASCSDFVELAEEIDATSCKLKMILDVPQLFTKHFGPKNKTKDDVSKTLNSIMVCRDSIKGLHLWGKRRGKNDRWISHVGNLTTYFDNNLSLKNHFLKELFNLLNDKTERYFVPEVNSGEDDLQIIIKDLLNVGFRFA